MLEPGDLAFWGKGDAADGAAVSFHPVAYHLLDVAAVVDRILVARPIASQRASRLLGMSEAQARTLLVTLAALHDLGKFAPAFQAKVSELWPSESLGPYDPANAVIRPHTEDGLLLWDGCLDDLASKRLLPDGSDILHILAPAVFGHHGRPVCVRPYSEPVRSRFGKGLQPARRCGETVLDLLCPEPIATTKIITDREARIASWWVAGLITIADWIGSNTRWYPYVAVRSEDLSLQEYWTYAREQAGLAVRDAGLCQATPAALSTFGTLTGITSEATPLQEWAETATLPAGPTLVIIEDVTGAGKTEAAQMLVYRLMAAGRAAGAYWAMPTMATANAMYERQSKMIDRLFVADAGKQPSLVLAHGQQRLHSQFRSTVIVDGEVSVGDASVENGMGAEDDELASSIACSAFLADDRRAALLADVGAGTVDQALLGALPSRFNTIRLFGLAAKVLVIDEAHAYDAYMGVEVRELLRFQAALGGCAIVLSATLSRRQRESLAQAWADGVRGGGRMSVFARPEDRVAIASMDYPLATTVSEGQAVKEHSLSSAWWSRRTVLVRFVHDMESTLAYVRDAAASGAAVAWIRNTVADCVAAASLLRQKGLEVIVFHARFAQGDRQRREREVLDQFGRAGSSDARRGKVVVATQVIEQSLDLDFDTMVSDLAPIDLLVQRAGRLHRHPERNGDRPIGAQPELVVHSPTPTSAPSSDWLSGEFAGTARVYENAGVLWRTVQVLSDIGEIATPGGLRALIERVYDSDEVPAALEAATARAHGQEGADAAAATYAVLKPTDGYHASAQAWLSELRVPTRLGRPQVTVRLARVDSDGMLRPWVDTTGPSWRAWALSEVRIAAYLAPLGSSVEPHFAEAQASIRKGWGRFEQEVPILPMSMTAEGAWEGALVLPNGKPRRFSYSESTGLELVVAGDGTTTSRGAAE